MDLFPKLDPKTWRVVKMAGFGLLAAFVVVFAVNFIGIASSQLRTGSNNFLGMGGSMGVSGGSKGYATGESAYDSSAPSMPTISVRNSMPYPMPPGGPAGDQAEEFEVTDYSATIESRDVVRDCGMILGLKARDYVIFERANEHDRGCDYGFKVKRDRAAEILAFVKDMDPKEISESTYTIKRQVDDFTSELEILEKKKASIDETLKSAILAYDGITALATRVQDVESLARIIESKLQIIGRLTEESIAVSAQIERLQRAKADQLDRVDYVSFSINVYENKFVDGEYLADSWKAAVKQTVYDINRIAQQLTIGLAVLLLLILQYGLYLLIVLVVAKYGWRFAKRFWKA